MVYVFLADGFEEVEAFTPVDVLRRAGCDVRTVGISSRTVRGSHGILVECDLTDDKLAVDDVEMIVLPGGMPGTLHLEQSAVVRAFIGHAVRQGLPVGAICAAPSILGHMGLLDGKTFTCFPGYEDSAPAGRYTAGAVEQDGNFITAAGAGVALPFALKLAEVLKGQDCAEKLGDSMQCR